MGAGKGDIKHRFEIIRKLGSGTYGKVSLAYDHKNEREVSPFHRKLLFFFIVVIIAIIRIVNIVVVITFARKFQKAGGFFSRLERFQGVVNSETI